MAEDMFCVNVAHRDQLCTSMIPLDRLFLKLCLALCVVMSGAASAASAGIEAVAIPPNIVARNVPPLAQSLADRLAQYANARSASIAGWQGDAMLIITRFGQSNQLHRVAQPMGYREQLTFLPEPLGGVAIPKRGAQDKIVLNWDVGGSEFDQLFLFDVNDGSSRMVSDGKSLYAEVKWSPDETRFAYVTTERNGRNWDIHVQDLHGNVQRVLETQEGYWLPLGWSPDGKRLLVRNRVSVNESSVHELDIDTKSLTALLGADEPMSIEQAAYDERGGIYFNSDADSEFLRLNYLNPDSGVVEVISKGVDWDVAGFALSPDFSRLVYVTNENGSSRLTVLRLPSRKHVRVPALPTGVVANAVFSPDSDRLAIAINKPTAPTDIYNLDLKKGRIERWTQSEVGGLNHDSFVEPQTISFESFDGRDIPAFVYTPKTPGPHAVAILIHGGPEAQYRPFFSTTVQSLLNELNVAVIAPNVRGSRGYGKSYLKLDDGRLREDSVKDIGALLDWIDAQDAFDSARVGVVGGSYGGYMVLACMVHYGERLAAAIDTVGISNFVTFLENTQSYRQDIRRVEYGDERDPAMRAFLESISPLNHVDKMVTPLLIAQGANDPRVPVSESEQIYQALLDRDVPTWYVLAKDEGHGFAKKVNRDYDRVAKLAFLQKYLAGQE